MAALEADGDDRAEMLTIAEAMESLRADGDESSCTSDTDWRRLLLDGCSVDSADAKPLDTIESAAKTERPYIHGRSATVGHEHPTRHERGSG